MKLNKKLLSIMALGTLGIGVFAPTIHAADSTATIEFGTPTEAPEILNPDNPDAPLDDDQPGVGTETNEYGVLTLDFVSNLQFETQKLNPNVTQYSANLVNKTRPFAQVTDIRGTGNGWVLRAQLGEFTNDVDETNQETLAGTTITLNNGIAVTPKGNNSEEPDVVSNAPDTLLTAGGAAVNVTTAATGAGMGTWLTRWTNDDITLNVPAAAASQGNHTSTITWTLYDTPEGADEDEVINQIEGED